MDLQWSQREGKKSQCGAKGRKKGPNVGRKVRPENDPEETLNAAKKYELKSDSEKFQNSNTPKHNHKHERS